MTASLDISEDMRRRAFDYYAHHEGVPLNAIATFLGIPRRRFWALRRQWGWPPRPEAIAANRPADPPDDVVGRPTTTRTGLREAAASLAHVTRARLDALVRDQTAAVEIDHDRTARTLSAYAKTLTIARSLLEQDETSLHEPEADDHQPRSIQQLRDELASHLERIVAEEEARGGDGLLV